MLKIFKKKEKLTSPISGKLINISDVNDAVFSQKMMGDGFAIIPSSELVASPYSGEIVACFPTKHAIGIKSEDGIEVLIHIGLDTVELKGEGFEAFVEQGSKVKQGDKLVEIDLDFIKSQGYDSTVIVVFPNQQILFENEAGVVATNQQLPIRIE